MEAQFYESNYQTDIKSLLIATLPVLAIVAVLGYIYAVLILFIPFIYVNVLMTVGYGILAAYLAEAALWYGKCRSETHALIFASFIALFAIYVQWAVWLQIIGFFGEEVSFVERLDVVVYYLTHPVVMWEDMKSIAEVGVWGFGENLVNGTMLWIVWILEALIILGVIVFRTGENVDSPFCETSNQWAKIIPLVPLTRVEEPKNFITQLAQKKYEPLQVLQAGDDMKRHTHAMIYHCEGHNIYYMSVNDRMVIMSSKKIKNIDTPLIEYMQIDNLVAQELIRQYGIKLSWWERLERFL